MSSHLCSDDTTHLAEGNFWKHFSAKALALGKCNKTGMLQINNFSIVLDRQPYVSLFYCLELAPVLEKNVWPAISDLHRRFLFHSSMKSSWLLLYHPVKRNISFSPSFLVVRLCFHYVNRVFL